MPTKQMKLLLAVILSVSLAACGGGGGDDPPASFTLTVAKTGNGAGTVSGGGIACGGTCSASVEEGTVVTLTATAASGSSFGGWSGACTGTAPTCAATMTAARSVTATFFGRRLLVTTTGTGEGTVTASPDGLACGSRCTAYAEGTEVTLTAEAASGSSFSGWSGACTGAETTCTVTMSAAQVVTATFGEPCSLPAQFDWSSTGPLATPETGLVSLKDFAHFFYDGQNVVYMSNVNTNKQYGSAMAMFGDWSEMADADQLPMSQRAVAPTIFYFQPKDVWVLAYQWGTTPFSYKTSSNPTNVRGWSSEHPLYAGGPPAPITDYGPIDQTLICDADDCYMFFAGDNGKIYRSIMPIADFPGVFPEATEILSEANEYALFEGVQVYTVQGTGQYLMIVECIGSNGRRYFRAFVATDLGGEWTPITTSESEPFAGAANVTFAGGTAWTHDISHGDLVRTNPDQTFTVDACNLQFLYQGSLVGHNAPHYDLIPWRPALLTLQR